MRTFRHRRQRTIRRPIEVSGVGYLTGAVVRLRFCPAPPGSGVVFVRTDLQPNAVIRAHVENVTGTARSLGIPLSTLKFKMDRLEIRDLARKIRGN